MLQSEGIYGFIVESGRHQRSHNYKGSGRRDGARVEEWANNPQVGALRRRVHAPSGARVTVHQGAPDSAGVAGLLTHCEQVVIHPEGYQTYAVRGRPVRVIYNAKSSELLAITIGEVRVNELPDVNNVAVIPTACATAGGVKWLARKNSRRVGILGLRGQAKSQLAACKAILRR